MTLATYNEESYARSVLKINGEAGRFFGTRHREAHESAQNLLSWLPQPYRISNAEKIRVLGLVEGPTPPSSHGSQPRRPRGGPTPPSGHGSQPRSPRGGAIIHQMYGLFKDNKAMPTLFEDSMQRWRQVARNMGAKYHLWNADEVDALIKQRYEWLWQTYRDALFPLMRVNIARFAIVQHYGGMCVDLDVFPNYRTYECGLYDQVSLTIVAWQPTSKVPSSETTSDTFKKSSLDVKVVMACADNDIANIVLRFMCKQVSEKWLWPKDKEYICHTTGRSCVVKCLIDRWANPDKQLQYFSCSELAKPSPMCDVQCVASSSQDCEMNGASSSQDCEIVAVECGP